MAEDDGRVAFEDGQDENADLYQLLLDLDNLPQINIDGDVDEDLLEEQEDQEMTPLQEGIEGPLALPLIEEQGDNPQRQRTAVEFVLPFLSVVDMKEMRLTCRAWNGEVIASPRFQQNTTSSIRTAWYQEVRDQPFNFANTVKWRNYTMQHFNFYKNSEKFKTFWPHASSHLTQLTLHHCSFECDGFKFILDFSPNLTSLSMKNVKLRDVRALHREGDAPTALTARAVPPVASNLRHIHFEDMYVIEGCFFDYLYKRTGNLESIVVKNCFTQQRPLPFGQAQAALEADEITVAERLYDFHEDFVALLDANHQTLKKLVLVDILFVNDLLRRVAEEFLATPDAFPIPTNLTVSFDADSFLTAPNFFIEYCRQVTSLKLQLMQAVPNDQVIAALNAINPDLIKLRISVNGGATCPATLDVTQAMQRFTRLEKFQVEDRRPQSVLERRIIRVRHRLFPYRMHRGHGPLAHHLRQVISTVDSKINLNVIFNLPASVTELRISKVFNFQNIFGNPTLHEGLLGEQVRRLTKLEITGPWFFPLDAMIIVLYREGVNLETLILSACSLNDTNITGLCREAVYHTRKSRGLVHHLCLSKDGKDPEEFDALVRSAPAQWDRNRVMTNMGYDAEPKARVSNLPRLQHLDLSHNCNITDVGIYDGMRIPNLKSLTLHSCDKVTDIGLEVLTENCPNLEVLNIKNCRKVSKYGIDTVVRRCHKIQTIYTTKIIGNREIDGFQYQTSGFYNNVVKTCIWTPMAGVNDDEAPISD